MSENQPKYKRILLKLSGEALAGDKKMGLDMPTVTEICKSIKKCYDVGAEIGIVVGGGNYWRGRSSENMDRVRADHIGMLATAMNALAVADVLESLGCQVRVQTAIDMKQIAEPYIRQKAVRHFEKGRIVIFGCGTGSPFFSTDSAAALRAAEINADIRRLWLTVSMTRIRISMTTLLSTTRSHISRYSCRASRLWTVPLRLCAVRTRHLSLYLI